MNAATPSSQMIDSQVQVSRKGAAQRGVRFLDPPDPDDDVPLGYAIQVKKKREEKEKFLRAEREKRLKELEERRAVEEEEERKRLDEERRKLEMERKRLEEMKQERYKEELLAARHRRESVNFGLETLREAQQKERKYSYSRPDYDPTPLPSSVKRRSVDNGRADSHSPARTPGSSNPPSVQGSSEDLRRNSVPEGDVIYASSVGFRARRNRKHSIVSDAPSRVSQAQTDASRRNPLPRSNSTPLPIPIPVGVYPVMYPQMPPVPPIPMGWNMPLLPPTPPFMMQQYPFVGPVAGSYANSRDSSPSRQSSGPHTPPTPPYNSSLQVPKMPPHRIHRTSDPTSRRPSALAAVNGAGSKVNSGSQGTWPRNSVVSQTQSLSSRSQPHREYQDNTDRARRPSQASSRTLSSTDTRRRTSYL